MVHFGIQKLSKGGQWGKLGQKNIPKWTLESFLPYLQAYICLYIPHKEYNTENLS